MNTVEYRSVVVRLQSRSVLVVADRGQYRLPRVQISGSTRPARELQKVFRAKWGLNILILETWIAPHASTAFFAAELLPSEAVSCFCEVPIRQLAPSEIFDEDLGRLEQFFDDRRQRSISRFGWIEEAIGWIESATGHRFSRSSNIEQWNAGGGFALLRLCSIEGRHYWFKATAGSNAHEFALTRFLSESYPDFLPRVVATSKEWNAWLTEDGGEPLTDVPTAPELVSAARRMAQLQILAIGQTNRLLVEGAFDNRTHTLRSHIDVVISYLIEAMARQTSTKVAPLSRTRLLELGEILRDSCFCLEELDIPNALIHNDLNTGNILWNGNSCVFADWCESAVGNPFLCCERLCQLNRIHEQEIRTAYWNTWSYRLTFERFNRAMTLVPLFAIYAYLFGRGDWLKQANCTRPHFDSYARSLARHMDRAAKEAPLLEVLCH